MDEQERLRHIALCRSGARRASHFAFVAFVAGSAVIVMALYETFMFQVALGVLGAVNLFFGWMNLRLHYRWKNLERGWRLL